MIIEKTTKPYELLFRWRDGVLVGAHVQFITVLREGAVVLNETVGEAMPVSVGASVGFPLSEILTEMHAAAVARAEEANGQLVAMREDNERLVTEHQEEVANLQAELAATANQAAVLAAQLAEAKRSSEALTSGG